MPTGLDSKAISLLDPARAPERVDILVSCTAPLREIVEYYPGSTVEEATLKMESGWLGTATMDATPDKLKARMNEINSLRPRYQNDSRWLAKERAVQCFYSRRLAQLNGSSLMSGAVDGSLTPLSIGGPTPPWKQQGKDAHTIAGDGKSAMHCVTLEQSAPHDSSVSGGMRRLVNHCSDEVEINWCNSPGNCEKEQGSTWTVQPGYSWPVSAEGEVRWSACHGRDSASTVKGSYGMRYYCTAPLVEPRR